MTLYNPLTTGSGLIVDATTADSTDINPHLLAIQTAIDAVETLANRPFPQVINANPVALPAAPVGTLLHVGNANGQQTRHLLDAFGSNASFTGRASGGTNAVKTALLANAMMVSFRGFGYGTTAYSAAARAAMSHFSAENSTDTAQGSYTTLSTTANGTTTLVERVRISHDGTCTFGAAFGAESLRVLPVAGANRAVTTSGSSGGNPSIGTTGGNLVIATTGVFSGAGTVGDVAVTQIALFTAAGFPTQQFIDSARAVNAKTHEFGFNGGAFRGGFFSDNRAAAVEWLNVQGTSAAVTSVNLTGPVAVTGAISATTTISTGSYTVATLPAGTVGQRAFVTDATAPTFLTALTGGGGVRCPVFRNATVWVSA